MLKLLIFDLDGTLLDTSVDITNAINHALEPFGVKPFSVEKIKSTVGSGLTKLIESLIPAESLIPSNPSLVNGKMGDSYVKDKTLDKFLEHYTTHLLDNTRAYPGVKDTLSKLGAYKKAVISNKRESLSREVLDGTGLSEFFDVILGSDSVPEKKPSPVPIIEVLKSLRVSKDETVIIGDSNFDIEAGKAAGIKTIAVTYGYRSREVLKEADFMIDSFEELLSVIKKID